MKTLSIAFALLISTSLIAHEHSLGAHEHGTLKMGMAIEKNIIDIDLDGPTESFLNFEYLPKTVSEKKLFKDTKELWEKKLFDLIIFDKKLNCKISEAKFSQIIDKTESSSKKEEGVHSDIEATAKITCASDPIGSNVQIALKKQFKNIKNLSVEIISGATKKIEITKSVQSIKI